MNATRFEFRYRVLIIVLLYGIGFLGPWNLLPGQWSRGESWGLLIAQLNRTGLLSFNHSFFVVNILVVASALAGALLRWWATAFLGAGIMASGAMFAEKVVDAGPYRYLRNPLYLGAWLLAIPLAILMRPGGAVFLMVALTLFLLRLIGAEQAFLERQLGDAYRRYHESVRGIMPGTGGKTHFEARPDWFAAAIAESYGLLLAISFSILCWRFNAQLLERCAIISFGISLVLNAAFAPRRAPATN